MLSYNQQGVADGNFGTYSNTALSQQWTPAVQPNWGNNSEVSQFNEQKTWAQSATFNPTSSHIQGQFAPQYQQPQYQPQYQQSHQFNQNYVPRNIIPDQMQTNQVPVRQSPSFYTMQNQYLQSGQQNRPPVRAHQARITLVPNATGGFKAIVKRKRKRTMFTTEQVEAMESVFQRKPYVTRDDRQVLVDQLQLNDTAVKVWFQNRRLRGKRAVEEAAAQAAEQAMEQAMFEEQNKSEQSLYDIIDSLHQEAPHQEAPHQEAHHQESPHHESSYHESTDTDSSCSTSKLSHLDILESELSQRADESGYITLDDKSIGVIVSAIDSVLSPDVSLDLDMPSASSEDVNLPSNPSLETVTEDLEETKRSTSTESVYEAISPAGSPASSSTEEEIPRWKSLIAPEQSLQQLFDLHFC